MRYINLHLLTYLLYRSLGSQNALVDPAGGAYSAPENP